MKRVITFPLLLLSLGCLSACWERPKAIFVPKYVDFPNEKGLTKGIISLNCYQLNKSYRVRATAEVELDMSSEYPITVPVVDSADDAEFSKNSESLLGCFVIWPKQRVAWFRGVHYVRESGVKNVQDYEFGGIFEFVPESRQYWYRLPLHAIPK